jgi:AcrR family transcriptional regulator
MGDVRKQVLTAAWKVYKDYGYAATTLDRIARESSVPLGLIGEYFSDRDELFYAIVEDATSMMETSASELIAAAIPDIAANIQGYMAIILNYRDDYRAYRAIVREIEIVAEPKYMARIREKDGVFSEALAIMLRGLAEKSLIKECDYEAASVAVVEAYAALVSYRDAKGDFLPDWRVRDMLQSLLYGGVMHSTMSPALGSRLKELAAIPRA